jgi:hypothetical protein
MATQKNRKTMWIVSRTNRLVCHAAILKHVLSTGTTTPVFLD